MVLKNQAGQEAYSFREIGSQVPVLQPQPLPAKAAKPLLAFDPEEIVVCGRNWRGRKRCRTRFGSDRKSQERTDDIAQQVIDFLDTEGFVSVPLPMLSGKGRLYLTSRTQAYSEHAALFLHQVVDQAFGMLAHVELLDRMATDGAEEERRRISGDLHDSMIQPYIGLKLGLDALVRKASPQHTIYSELVTLVEMTQKVVTDLRQYVERLRGHDQSHNQTLLIAIHEKVKKFHEYYGIQVDVDAQGEISVPGRLGAEVLQIVGEGLGRVIN